MVLGFMLVEVRPKENPSSNSHKGEALQRNYNFFSQAKELGLESRFVHTDKDYDEISTPFKMLRVGLECKCFDRSWQVQDGMGSMSFV